MNYNDYLDACPFSDGKYETATTTLLRYLMQRGGLCEKKSDSQGIKSAHRQLFEEHLLSAVENLQGGTFPLELARLGLCTSTPEKTCAIITSYLGEMDSNNRKLQRRLNDALLKWVSGAIPAISLQVQNPIFLIYIGYELLLIYLISQTLNQGKHAKDFGSFLDANSIYQSLHQWAGHTNRSEKNQEGKGKPSEGQSTMASESSDGNSERHSTITESIKSDYEERATAAELRLLEKVLKSAQEKKVQPVYASVASKIITGIRAVGECKPTKDATERDALLSIIKSHCNNDSIQKANTEAVTAILSDIEFFEEYAARHPQQLGSAGGRPPRSVSTPLTGYEYQMYWSWGKQFTREILDIANEFDFKDANGLGMTSVLLAPLASPTPPKTDDSCKKDDPSPRKRSHHEVWNDVKFLGRRGAAVVAELYELFVNNMDDTDVDEIFRSLWKDYPQFGWEISSS